MSKSKRKRKSVLVRKFSVEELKKRGIEIPEHIRQLKNPRKHFCLEDYKNLMNPLLNSISSLSNLTGNPINQNEKSKQIELYINQIFIARSAVIQYFVILDHMINRILFLHQSEQGKIGESIRNYSEVDKGLKEFLKPKEKPKEFEKLYSRVKHFRTLRNQFAHYPHGNFSLNAKRESFESFLEGLEGIETDPKKGYHCYIDGKPGFQLPYTSSSSDYLNDLFKTGTDFFKVLLEIFLPDSNIEEKESDKT